MPAALAALIEHLVRLPGVGPKTAQRLAFHLLKVPREDAAALAEALVALKDRTRLCQRCFNLCEAEVCGICVDARRDGSLLCVVEEINDLLAIEKTREFRGLYHVLGGSLSPLDGRGPEQIRAKELQARLESSDVREVILATNPNVEGEATALYLLRLLKPFPLKVTRIARGLPMGGDLEYADEATLARALEGRREIG
ncbi:MAG: recombination protein RecR [candidate division NC10 bacterium RBG_16_65_8]|nr:MAG: recombination protein RecR [candidate division NC10 bacterium RBG_16_65_8]